MHKQRTLSNAPIGTLTCDCVRHACISRRAFQATSYSFLFFLFLALSSKFNFTFFSPSSSSSSCVARFLDFLSLLASFLRFACVLALRLSVFYFLRCAFPCSCVAPFRALALRLSSFICASCVSIVFRLRVSFLVFLSRYRSFSLSPPEFCMIISSRAEKKKLLR